MNPNVRRALDLLQAWLGHAEGDWYAVDAGSGCYGTGFGHWGVQTNQKYLSAAAACAILHPGLAAPERERWLGRALAAFRFMLASHRTGTRPCLDGKPWGCDWISVLGIERMAFALPWLEPHLAATERASWLRLVEAEAAWVCDQHERHGKPGIHAGLWDKDGTNHGESNLWNGCFLWRAALWLPTHADAPRWRERSSEFLANGVSLPADASDPRHRGANFFPSFAFDHHGYLNVGYMAICVSNAAFLHFDAKAQGFAVPAELHQRQDGLWSTLRRMVFPDGRLARIGGDSRVRYAYCQDYALPAYLYAADQLRDGAALDLAKGLLGLMEREAAANRDGSFFGLRLAELRRASPYFATRLEADRANVLAMLATWLPRIAAPPATVPAPDAWHCPDHGAALVRSPRRFASLSWRSKGLGQILCLPPGDSSLAEWRENLAGCVRFVGEDESLSLVPGRPDQTESVRRSLLEQRIEAIPGGWLGSAAIREGDGAGMSEYWKGEGLAITRLAAVALPDDATVCVLRLTRCGANRAFVRHVAGGRLLVPNDLLNGRLRRLASPAGERELAWPPAEDQDLALGPWACIDGRLGLVGLYGAASLVLHRSRERRGGAYRSLACEELDWGRDDRTRSCRPDETILDAGWLACCGDAAQVATCAAQHRACRIDDGGDGLRAVALTGADGRRWLFAANLGETQAILQPSAIPGTCSCTGRELAPGGTLLHPLP